jgi:hypothetical protein
MTSIVAAKPIRADIGAGTITGTLFLAEPSTDSFINGTLSVFGLVETALDVVMNDDPVCVDIKTSLVDLHVCFRLDLRTQELLGRMQDRANNSGLKETWQKIANL